MKSRTNRVLYYFFYLLFSIDTWRIVIGLITAVVFTPALTKDRNYSVGGEVMLWLMVLTIGYAAAGYPAKYISKGLQRFFTMKP